MEKKESTETETLEAKLRNLLTPSHDLPGLVLRLKDNPDLLPIILDSVKQALANRPEIARLLSAMEKRTEQMDKSIIALLEWTHRVYPNPSKDAKGARIWNPAFLTKDFGVNNTSSQVLERFKRECPEHL